ncbi:hypothetical protein LXL04_019203 [Taraxacum kok-saghyz]
MSFPHDGGSSFSAFVRKADSVQNVDPCANGIRVRDGSNDPYSGASFSDFVHQANSVLAVPPGVNGNLVWDTGASYSAFVHQADSISIVDPQSNMVFSQEEESLKGSSPDIGEVTVKQVLLQHAMIVPETTSIYEACCQMAAGKADALVITDSNAKLSGVTNSIKCSFWCLKDFVKRIIARGIDVVNTPVSKVMTKNPIFVMSDALCVKALQKMVQGKVKQLPVLENGRVIGLANLTICLFGFGNYPEGIDENHLVILAAADAIGKRMIRS